MGFLKREKATRYGVMDVGSDAIRALVFEIPSAGGAAQPVEKFVWEISSAYSPLRLVRKIRESVFAVTHKLKLVPDRIVIGLGPEVAECIVQSWAGELQGSGRMLTRKDIRASYEHLFEKHADLRRAAIVTPVELFVNGYALQWRENWFGDEILSRKEVKEIRFRTLALSMPLEIGAAFAEIKNSLGGIAIEFVPLAVAEQEAIARGLAIRDALMIDVRGDATALVVIKEGRFAQGAFMPFGVRRFAQGLAKGSGYSLVEARALIRQHGQGMGKSQVHADVSASVTKTAAEWKKFLIRTLDSLSRTSPLPQVVLLCGAGASLPEVRTSVQAGDWLGAFSHVERPSLRVLEGSTFFGGDTLGGHLGGAEDAGLASLMIYLLHHQPLF